MHPDLDPDLDPDPAISAIDLQDANKNFCLKQFIRLITI
jgi:hypothetical protein